MTRTLILLGLLIASGCAKALIEAAPVSVPSSLLTCKDAPAKAEGEDYTQKAVRAYVIGIHEAHADCKSKLDAVRGAVSN